MYKLIKNKMEKEYTTKVRKRVIEELYVVRVLVNNPKFWIILCVDQILIVFALYLSYIIRLEHSLPGEYVKQFFGLLPLLISVKVSCFYIFGLYRGMWRYTSTRDLLNILKATLCSAVLIIVMLLYMNRFEGLSRSVFVLDTLFTFLFIIGHRVAIRFYYQNSSGNNKLLLSLKKDTCLKRLLLVGAGDAAEKVIREIQDNKKLTYQAVGLVDDDLKKTGMKIHGIPVLGPIADVEEHVNRIGVDEILIAISSISGPQMKRIVNICQNCTIPYKVLPSMGELINGQNSLDTIRDIDYKDLLGRKEIRLDQERIGNYITGNTILVTGAGGSIGSELCRQIQKFEPERIVLFDASEENLYNIQMELIHEYKNRNIEPILGKIQDLLLLNSVFSKYRPSVVFHAAAYKHVPLVECNPWQAVENNIIGSQLIIEASIVYNVNRFVLVSSDKAVRPTNIMGASKRISEHLMYSYSKENWDGFLSQPWRCDYTMKSIQKRLKEVKHSTVFMAVRFGNVLGSSGSVIPLFKRQIENGGPVTVTHPEVTRYFMSIDEAAQLIIQAGSMAGEGGEIYILKMGQPIKIDQMAYDLIKLAGKEPHIDVGITYVGLRDGEKLYEELITDGEGILETYHEEIMVLCGDKHVACSTLNKYIEQLLLSSREFNSKAIKEKIQEFIPEYQPTKKERITPINYKSLAPVKN